MGRIPTAAMDDAFPAFESGELQAEAHPATAPGASSEAEWQGTGRIIERRRAFDPLQLY
jgi:hypothetical protein